MPLYIGDYLADTAHLDAERSGCYLHWLMHYWRKGPLPDDLDKLTSIGKLRTPNARSIAQELLRDFFTFNVDGRWHQERVDSEKAKWCNKRQKANEKASKASRSRWKKLDATSIGEGMFDAFPSPSPSHSPSSAQASATAPLSATTTATNPPSKRAARELAQPQTVGEFGAATYALDQLGLAAGPYDVQMLGQVIAYTVRDAACTVEDATLMLLDAAQAAIGRGETVNVFWFKDRRFATGGNDGKSKQSRAKSRIDDNRRAIAAALAKRGVDGPWNTHRSDGTTVADAGYSGLDRRVPDGSGAARDSRGNDDGTESGRGSANFADAEILPPS